MVHSQIKDKDLTEGERGYGSTYSTHYVTDPIPKYRLPEKSMPAHVAHQLCLDELNLDGNPHLNLASFVTTWMEPEDNATVFL
jgi:glutamate decarboxylase